MPPGPRPAPAKRPHELQRRLARALDLIERDVERTVHLEGYGRVFMGGAAAAAKAGGASPTTFASVFAALGSVKKGTSATAKSSSSWKSLFKPNQP